MKIKHILLYIAITVIAYHLLAVFGIILAILLPFLWLISPKKFLALYNKFYKFINLKNSIELNVLPKLTRVLLISLIILLLSNISILLVYFEGKYIFNFDLLELSSRFTSSKTELSIEKRPTNTKDNTEIYDIFVSSDKAVNLIQADIRFSTDAVIIVDIELEKSFVNIVLKKEFSVDNGNVNIIVGIPNPGFIGKGLLAQIKVINSGSQKSHIDFLSSSKILANDGDGTLLSFKVLGASIEVK